MWLDLVDRISESKGGGNTMTEMKHGGSNHHEAANYNLGEHAVGGSLYERKRYSKSAKSYRRGGALKKFQDEGQVNTEETVVPTEVPVTPVVANTNTEIPVVPLIEEKGEGYGGRQLYDGPLKDLNVHNFIQFANEDGSPNLSWRPEYVKDGVVDPEVLKWRSEKRGLSVEEILQWYMFTQLAIPPEAHTVSDYSDYSYWGGENYGKIRQPVIDDNGNIKIDINGYPMWEEFNEEKHNEYLEKSKSNSEYAWYPNNSSDAFAMARDMGLKTFFYDGQPKLAFLPSEIEQMEEKQIEADKVAQAKWFDHHSTNPSEQFTTWLGTKDEETCTGNCEPLGMTYDDEKDQWVKDTYDRMNLSDISNETMVYMQTNHPELLEFVDPAFDNEEDAFNFIDTYGSSYFGGAVTVNGKKLLMQHGTNGEYDHTVTYGVNEGNTYTRTTNDITGQYFDENALPYMKKLNSEYENHWKTKSIASGDVHAVSGGWSQEQFMADYDHSNYKTNYVKVNSDNYSDAMETHPEKFGLHSYQQYYDTPVRTEGAGAYTYTLNGNKIDNPLHTHNAPSQKGLESLISFGNIFWGTIGAKPAAWLGGKLFNWGTNRVIGGGASALKTIWTGARSPLGQQTFKNGAWQFTKNTAATAYQPMKFASDTYSKSWLNRWVMSPAIPGTYGVASGNTAFNAMWANESYKAAKKDFSEGDYLWGTANALFTGMNVLQPYRRYKNFDHLNLKTVDWKTNPISLSTSGGNYRFTDKGRKYMHDISNLPSSRLRNYAPKIFGYKPTQTNIGKDLKISFDKYEKINTKSPMENMLLKYSPK